MFLNVAKEGDNMVNWKSKKMIALYIFLGVVVLAGIFGSGNKDTSKGIQQAGGITQPELTETNVPEKEYLLGDEIQAGDFKWKITNPTTTPEIGEYAFDSLIGKEANGIFLILDIEVENIGKKPKYLTDSYIRLIDEQNREFAPDTVAAIYLKPQGSALIFDQLNPGVTKKGKIVFDVPTGLKVANIKIKSSSLTTETYSVKIAVK